MVLDGQVRWPEHLVADYVAKGYWRGVALGSLPWRWADARGHRTALVDGDSRLGYDDLARRVDALAANLLSIGLRPADTVLVQLHNCWEFVVTVFAAARIGVVPVLALPGYRERELAHIARHAAVSAAVVPTTWRGFDHQRLALDVAAGLDRPCRVLAVGAGVSPDATALRPLLHVDEEPAALRARLDALAPPSGDVALLLMSGGTTGPPKLIARTHDDYEYNARRSGELSGLGPDSVYLVSLPAGHNFPLGSPGLLGALLAGGTVVMLPSPEPEAAFAAIARERVTITSVVPAVAHRWLEHHRPDRHDLSSLRVVQVGGARLAPDVARRLPRLGCAVQQVFGMAEGLLNFTRLDDPPDVVAETQGRPMCPDDEVRIVDEAGDDVPFGRPGELLTRGPYTPRGYFRGGRHDVDSFTPDGWYRTGDVVRWHPSGNLVVTGRVKDLINRAGEKISAQELEDVLYSLPWVARAAVVGVPDAELGERVCACVVPGPGPVPDLAEVRAEFAARGVAVFKLPEQLRVFDALPLTDIGKPDKKKLRALLAANTDGHR
ncbi:(2,3-dihydroxybenzoyl)adenylate synthase [Saccharothrix australiensis]|uniref:2,3-dihydroxybenzoate-AMP ligase n=1 Tax=Saccharothrix australiensis TaxID=2072 RepID=A0A495W0Q5_9PSEU|nr:AMP-binding protein [Saccharothrix australiensis]RKT54275.1 2,3-dihydroxybenzoate-AMP ligase [Saccharothrix australiensis]